MTKLKSPRTLNVRKLTKVIDESLSLLVKADINEYAPEVDHIAVPSLLDQCLVLCEQHHSQTQDPLRIVHHFGLPVYSPLLSCLATIANARVLTDIYPNNNSFKDSITSQTLVAKGAISDQQTKNSDWESEHRNNVFLNHLQQIQHQSNQIGQRLIICDNPCLSSTGKGRRTDLLAMIKNRFSVQSIIVVIDPIDSYSIYCETFNTGIPFLSFDEHCRSILIFLQMNPDLTVIRHEDFVNEPEKVMRKICEVLGVPFCELFLVLGEAFCG